ncbi:MAG: alpha amylase family protein [Armatimonadota bacterium]
MMRVRGLWCALVAVLSVGVPARAQEALRVLPPSLVEPILPFPHLPRVPLDTERDGFGEGQRIARERNVQARVLWIDATANLERVNTTDKVDALIRRIAGAGFNTVVLDVKPIIGETLYPSKFAPKMTRWARAGIVRNLPAEFDPLDALSAAAKRAGLSFLVSMNAFSEGHRDFPGRGAAFEHPEWQSVLYEEALSVRVNGDPATDHPVADRADAPPKQPDDLAVYVTSARVPVLPSGASAAALDPGGKVVALVGDPASTSEPVSVPTGGCVLVGFTPVAAEYLRANAQPGAVVSLEHRPVYVPVTERIERQVPVMTNPHLPEVRRRLCDMVGEVLSRYPVDGVVFDDRLRFAALNADFSEPAKRAFEQWIGRSVQWPDDIFRYAVAWPSLVRREVPGPLFDAWSSFKALTLRNFLAEVVRTARAAKPGALVGTYVGSWYPDYPDIGANWAADDVSVGYRFVDEAWRSTGWAGLVDFVVTGCYYTTATIREAARNGEPIGATVEAAGQVSNRVVNDQTWVYAGLALDKFKGREQDLKGALQAAAATTQGIMCFDLSHDIEPLWGIFEDAFRQPARPPHADPSLRKELAAAKARRKASGVPDPPVILYTGVSGTGF